MEMREAHPFEAHRPLLFAIAYRMLGSVSDAEDIVQEAYLRYQAVPPQQVAAPKAFLSTVVTRLCLNHLQSARQQRETYIGPWLPEPLPTDARAEPDSRAELHESLSLAFLVLLEQLTPLERAVFLLHEVFDYPHAEVAAILGKEEAACRKTFSRAKRHIAAGRPRFTPAPETHRQLLAQFMRAVSSGDLDGLRGLLAEDVSLWADGGGKVRGALNHPLHGRDAVARFLTSSARFAAEPLQGDVAEVNGEPALVLRAAGATRLVVSISSAEGQIAAIRVVGNPEKLRAMDTAAPAAESDGA